MSHVPQEPGSPFARPMLAVGGGSVPEIACVPRRFGIATLLTVSTACAALFGLLRYFQWDPIPSMLLFGFFCLVAVAQMWAGPRRARWVSAGIGGLCAFAPAVYQILMRGFPRRIEMLLGMSCWVLFGVLAGYLAGTLIAGLFLVIDRVDAAIERRRVDRGAASARTPLE